MRCPMPPITSRSMHCQCTARGPSGVYSGCWAMWTRSTGSSHSGQSLTSIETTASSGTFAPVAAVAVAGQAHGHDDLVDAGAGLLGHVELPRQLARVGHVHAVAFDHYLDAVVGPTNDSDADHVPTALAAR